MTSRISPSCSPARARKSLGMLAELSELHRRHPRHIRRSVRRRRRRSVGAVAGRPGGDAQSHRIHAAGVARGGRRGVARVARAGGARPARLAGHSLGEYTALVAAGTLSLADAAHLVRIRGQAMQDAAPEGNGAMAAVLGAEDALVEEVCREVSGDARRRAGELQLARADRHRRPCRRGRSRDRCADRARRAQGREACGQRALAYAADARGGESRRRGDERATRGASLRFRSCRTSTARCITASRRSAMRSRDSCICRCAGPAAWRRWHRPAPRASPNAGRARC